MTVKWKFYGRILVNFTVHRNIFRPITHISRQPSHITVNCRILDFDAITKIVARNSLIAHIQLNATRYDMIHSKCACIRRVHLMFWLFTGRILVKFTVRRLLNENNYGGILVNFTVKYLAAGLPTFYRKIYGWP